MSLFIIIPLQQVNLSKIQDSPTYSIQIGVKNGTNHTQRGDSPGSKSLDSHPEIEELEVPEPECYSSDVLPREIPLPLEELYSCLVEVILINQL